MLQNNKIFKLKIVSYKIGTKEATLLKGKKLRSFYYFIFSPFVISELLLQKDCICPRLFLMDVS